jgi:hypothetical protein
MAAPRAPAAWIPSGTLVVAMALGLCPARPARAADNGLGTPSLAVRVTHSAAAESSSTATPLPFAENEIPITYPRVSFALGVAMYSSALTGVEEAYRNFENAYSAAGYPQPHAAEASLGPMYLFTLTASLSPSLDLACQIGRTADQNNQLKLLGGIVSGRYSMPDTKNLSFSAGLGGGGYGFSFTRKYGGPVSPVDANGGYIALESIELKGGGAYWTAQGGVTLGLGRRAALNGLVQYVGAGDVSTDTARAGKVTVNVSGTMFGASFACFY